MGIPVQIYMEKSDAYFGKYTPAFFRETVLEYLAKCSNAYREKLLQILIANQKRSYGPPDIATMRSYEEQIIQEIKNDRKLLAQPEFDIDFDGKEWMAKHIKHLFDALRDGDKQKIDELHLIGLKRAWKAGNQIATLEAFELEHQGFNINNVPDEWNKQPET